MEQLKNEKWLRDQVKLRPLRHIALELGVPYTRVYLTVKGYGIEIPKRKKYVYTEKSRKAKSETIKAALQTRYPGGRYGEQAANWRGGMPKCQVCEKTLTRKDAARCSQCERSLNRLGENNINWQGGISPQNMLIRSSKDYRIWRKAVLERDNRICQLCGTTEGELHVDHIKSFSEFPDLRLAIDNGRVLCVKCHRATETWGVRKKNTVLP